ncbi:unnamed protein product, partial [Rotaria sp. Silwood2]
MYDLVRFGKNRTKSRGLGSLTSILI